MNAVINDKGIIKYERNANSLWNVCFALDAGFDICEKKTFDEWIEIIKNVKFAKTCNNSTKIVP